MRLTRLGINREALVVVAATIILLASIVAWLGAMIVDGAQWNGFLRHSSLQDAGGERSQKVVAPEHLVTSDAGVLMPISRERARELNAAAPVDVAPSAVAAPLSIGSSGAVSFLRARDCLTAAVYYEAASESMVGQRAVAQVVLNRVRHPAFPNTVCGVVFQGSEGRTGCQFSFTCDGSLRRQPSAVAWARARAIADAALSGFVEPSVGMATHYHTDWVLPYWSPKMLKLCQIGSHIFFRWPGAWGLPAAFTQDYRANEPVFAWHRGGFEGVALIAATEGTIESAEPQRDNGKRPLLFREEVRGQEDSPSDQNSPAPTYRRVLGLPGNDRTVKD